VTETEIIDDALPSAEETEITVTRIVDTALNPMPPVSAGLDEFIEGGFEQ